MNWWDTEFDMPKIVVENLEDSLHIGSSMVVVDLDFTRSWGGSIIHKYMIDNMVQKLVASRDRRNLSEPLVANAVKTRLT